MSMEKMSNVKTSNTKMPNEKNVDKPKMSNTDLAESKKVEWDKMSNNENIEHRFGRKQKNLT